MSDIPYMELYETMLLVRTFEERVLELFSEGRLNGTTHTYIGQEAGAVSIIPHLRDTDLIFTNHRCHGHYLTRFDDPTGLLAEMMGKVGGVCGGRGGSQHLCRSGFFSNGIQGGFMPIAVGMALAEKRLGTNSITVAFIGDGTLGEGALYEALNMASLWDAPILVVCENNRYAQTTSIEQNLAGRIIDRAAAFGISTDEVESNDVEVLFPRFKARVEQVRTSERPHLEVIHTYRLKAHSKGDDYRDLEEIAGWAERDPLGYVEGRLSRPEKAAIQERVEGRIAAAEQTVLEMADATLDRNGSVAVTDGAIA